MALQLAPTIVRKRKIEYPESDGKPMAETDLHREIMFFLIHTLQRFFKDSIAYISGNLLIYYVEGDPYKSVAPDCFVAFGVPNRQHNTYKTWEEGKFPDVVFEVTSKKTRREDFTIKQPLYARLGVKEYYIYDPTRDYLKPPLQAFELINNQLQPMKPHKVNGVLNAPVYLSKLLGLRLSLDEWGRLELFDVESGEQLLSDEEARIKAELQSGLDRERALLAAQREELERGRAEMAAQRAEQEAQRAEQEAQRAEQEAQRAEQAEREVAMLRAQLARMQKSTENDESTESR